MYFCMVYNSLYGFVLQFVNQIIDVIKHMSGLAKALTEEGLYMMDMAYTIYITDIFWEMHVCLKE